MKIAMQVGLKRRKFSDKEAAEKFFKNLKKEVFTLVKELQLSYPNEKLDYSPESLKAIEKIYFDYCDNNKFDETHLTQDEFEILLAIYEGQVYVKNGKAKWIIEEDAFVRDHRYFLAIKSMNNFLTIDCTKRANHNRKSGNKRRQMLYREYKKNEAFCN